MPAMLPGPVVMLGMARASVRIGSMLHVRGLMMRGRVVNGLVILAPPGEGEKQNCQNDKQAAHTVSPLDSYEYTLICSSWLH